MVEFTKKRLINTLFWLFSMCPRPTEVFACANTNMASFFRFKAYRFVNFYQENVNFYSACENSKSTATDYLEFSNDFGKVDIFVVQVTNFDTEGSNRKTDVIFVFSACKNPRGHIEFFKKRYLYLFIHCLLIVRIFVLKYKHL